ncbi:MAG: hypothetical protein IJJ33_14460 [Victivallales bacterium]|nr:hypothetical protein [Victivallales bacterium]
MRIRITHCLACISMFSILIAITGCMPTIAINDWSVPSTYRPYLPPDEKDDVLFVCIYDTGHKLIAADAQIMHSPYDRKARLGMTWAIGMGSVSWECTTCRSRHAILLFTKKHQMIYIPLRPYGAFDDALSYFYVANDSPIIADDFCCHKENDPYIYFNFVTTPYYYPIEKIKKQQTLFQWDSIENAKLAKDFWAATFYSQKHLPVASFWKRHSIFGITDQILITRNTTLK